MRRGLVIFHSEWVGWFMDVTTRVVLAVEAQKPVVKDFELT